MRLLNTKTFELENFPSDATRPAYAILSHLWGKDGDEVSFRDVKEGRIKDKEQRPLKISGSCELAEQAGFSYIWIDTCCIDNTNSVELHEAIRSMFKWYADASMCYAYLADVAADDQDARRAESTFTASRWFRRGWTLQELLAPKNLVFYNASWHPLGSKGGLFDVVEKATGIPSPFFLHAQDLRRASVAQRLSWASKRETKKPEDIVYCLFGLFGTSITIEYGEGIESAFQRLQEKLIRRFGDDSILAWGLEAEETASATIKQHHSGSVLASNPSDFANSGGIVAWKQGRKNAFDGSTIGGRMRLNIPLLTLESGDIFGLLKCGMAGKVVAIPLAKASQDEVGEYVRPQDRNSILVPKSSGSGKLAIISVRAEQEEIDSDSDSLKYCFKYEDTIGGLKVKEVVPDSRWKVERGLIEDTLRGGDDQVHRSFIRYCAQADGDADVLVILEIASDSLFSAAQPKIHVMTCEKRTSLGSVAKIFESIRDEAKYHNTTSIDRINLRVKLDAWYEGNAAFILRTEIIDTPPEASFNATIESELLECKWELSILEDQKITAEQNTQSLSAAIKEAESTLEKATKETALVAQQIKELESLMQQLSSSLEKSREDKKNLKIMHQETVRYEGNLLKRLASTHDRVSSLLSYGSQATTIAEGAQAPGPNERLPLMHWAAGRGHVPLMQTLLDREADSIRVKAGINNSTPMHYAAGSGCLEAVKFLIDRGADVEATDSWDETPIFDATRGTHEAVVRYLADQNANLERTTNEGSLLHFVVVKQHEPLITYFLERGLKIDQELKNKDGETYTMLHAYANRGQADRVKILLDRGASVDAIGSRSAFTALHFAAEGGHLEAVKVLVERGAEIDAVDAQRETALNRAARKNHTNVVEYLVAKNASLGNSQGNLSPLHCAAAHGNEDMLRLLLGTVNPLSVSINALSSYYRTALDYALKAKSDKAEACVKLLRERGAKRASELKTERSPRTATPNPDDGRVSPVLSRQTAPLSPLGERSASGSSSLSRSDPSRKLRRGPPPSNRNGDTALPRPGPDQTGDLSSALEDHLRSTMELSVTRPRLVDEVDEIGLGSILERNSGPARRNQKFGRIVGKAFGL